MFLGGKYTVGALSLMGAYDRSKFEGPVDSVAKVYTLGAVYRIGQTSLKASYGSLDLDGRKSAFIGLGGDYALSRRTSVYVSLGNNRPDRAQKATAYGVGLAHMF